MDFTLDKVARVGCETDYHPGCFLGRFAYKGFARNENAAVVVQCGDRYHLVLIVNHEFHTRVDVNGHAGVSSFGRGRLALLAGGERESHADQEAETQGER